ncbi:MAG TPA: LamG-like jellyroll fold domain-containing protein, partial [Candidatus Binatia bacterium]|nr:LamG-like jellyroll fold domain-containing protein [Candidatus Binatia bacterium]
MKMQRLNLCSHGGFLAAVAITVLSAASARADYQSTVLADNPIAYYPLNLATDTKQNGGGQYLATDLSGNTNDGVYVNIYPGYNNVTGPSAYITNGVAFDYLEYVDLSTGSNTALLNFSNTITMEAWVQPVSSTLSDADIIAKGYDSNLGYDEVTLRANGGSYYGGTYGPAGGKGVAGGTQTTDWTYVVCTYNGTNWNMYVNGELKATSPDTVGALDFPDPWAIGNGTADAANVRYFQGNISQVALYTNALTPGQVLTHYFVGKSGTTNPPPIITADPASATRYAGSYVTFAVSALSATPMSYQWNRGTSPAVPLDGETNATLKLSNLQPGDAGDYSVTITNTGGSSTSAAAVLTVLSGPAPGPTVQHFWHVGEDDNVLPTDSAGSNPFEYGFGTRTVVTNTHAPGSTASLSFGGDGGDWMNDVISVPDDAWVIEMWVRPTTVANPVSLLTLGDQ